MCVADLSVLLAQNPHRRERAVSSVPQGLLGGPRRLHALVAGAGGQAEGREAPEGPAEEGEAEREQEAPGQRESGAEEPRVRGGAADAAGRPRGAQEARVLWQVREDSQGGYQSEYVVCGIAGAQRK